MSMKEEGPPAFTAPANACDAHFHVFGPPGAHPYADGLRYTPPHAPWSEYQQLARSLGLVRYVFVQPSAYGCDNTCMLQAMQTVGTADCRGIVDVHEDDAGIPPPPIPPIS